MKKEVLDFLKTERVGVLAVKMPDGSPHGATLHFASSEDGITFVFHTSPSYRKVEALKQGDTAASFVVGTSEEIMKTLQMDGIAKFEDTEEIRRVYFEKFPEKLKKPSDGLFFTFTPTWWRFTDWKTPQGKVVLTSE